MMKWMVGFASAALLSTASPFAQGTQTPPDKAKPAQAVKIDLLIERYSSDNKKVSSMPFVVWMTLPNTPQARQMGSLRVGVDVPVGSNTETHTQANPGNASSTTTTANRVDYKSVGTSIDCYLYGTPDDGRYNLQINLSDTSIFDPEAQRKAALVAKGLIAAQPSVNLDASAFRTFSVNNQLPMRDGQTVEYAVATDKVTGEIVKVLVTMTISK